MAELRARQPDASITVLAPSWTKDVWYRVAEVDRVLDSPFKHGELGLQSRWTLGRSLIGQFDQAWVLPNSFKSALVPWFARVPVRTGYLGEQRFGAINDIRTLDPHANPLMVNRLLALGYPRNTPFHPAHHAPTPKLRPNPGRAQSLKAQYGLDQAPILALCPGAEYGSAKRWPVEHFAALARWADDTGFQVALLGSPKDQDAASSIARLAPNARNLVGLTSLADAIDLLSEVNAVVSNDSGLMHVAAALDRYVIGLFGSSSPAFTPPLGSKSRVMKLDLVCSPCFARTCPLDHLRCLKEIRPAAVQSLLTNLLEPKNALPRSPETRSPSDPHQ